MPRSPSSGQIERRASRPSGLSRRMLLVTGVLAAVLPSRRLAAANDAVPNGATDDRRQRLLGALHRYGPELGRRR